MKITVNKREKIMPENISIFEMMKLLNHGETSSIALAVNQEINSSNKVGRDKS